MFTGKKLSLVILSITSLIFTATQPDPKSAVLFDNYSYSNHQQLKKHGWIIRTIPGWPGVPGATWSEKECRSSKIPTNPTIEFCE
ncbi:MAG TPA: hypothetical protein VGQ39_13615 [Pyrinomonadaceae bacterium]|jgi:hypothetical protein|nr:hypothetical protein [Pyrinomonadaceae bacterium]